MKKIQLTRIYVYETIMPPTDVVQRGEGVGGREGSRTGGGGVRVDVNEELKFL